MRCKFEITNVLKFNCPVVRDTVLNEDGDFPSQLLDEYPLFTYSIWRISAIVNASCNNQGVMKL